jgi:hypothetical protein
MMIKLPVTIRNIIGKKLIAVFSLITIGAGAVLLSGCDAGNTNSQDNRLPSALPEITEDYYQNIIDATGINFKHSIGDDQLTNLVESVGGGAAFLDYDQDGYIDLYLSNGTFLEEFSDGQAKAYENHLFRNSGNGTFEDVTKIAGVGDQGYGMGISVGDYDNNGYPDIFITNHGPNVLYQNNADGTFTNISKKAGIEGDECSVGAAWLDYDNDGLLDIYVGNYIQFDPDYDFYYAPDGYPGPMAYDAEPDILYHNNGDGTFSNTTKQMGLYFPEGRAMGVGIADYDNDGFVDIYVANDHMVNFLFHNDAGKAFKEVGVMTGVAFNQLGEGTISMAVDFADFNGDGFMDIFVSDDAYCSLYKSDGKGSFTDISYISGIAVATAQHVGWASSFIDYDNDGDRDIFKVNGELKHLYGQEDQLFENNGESQFIDVSVDRGAYFKEALVGRGACFGDYDNDGDMDAYITNLNDFGVFLRNDHGSEQNWLMIKLVGMESNRDGVGARVKVVSGEFTQIEQKKSANGYLSQNDPRLHFGLGSFKKVDLIEVIWPSGKVQELENIDINQLLIVTEPL